MSDGEEWKGEPVFPDLSIDGPGSGLRMGRYVLDADNNPVPCDDLLGWARWFEQAERHVDQTLVDDRISVSTIFLGLDHSFAKWSGEPHAPVLWETMSFWHGEYLKPEIVTYELNGETRSYERQRPLVEIPENQERYTSLKAAQRGHRRHVAIAKRVLAELDAKQGAGFGKTPESKEK